LPWHRDVADEEVLPELAAHQYVYLRESDDLFDEVRPTSPPGRLSVRDPDRRRLVIIPIRFVDGTMKPCHTDYPNVITESPEQLHESEKRYRYTNLFQRVRMLRLLKSEECMNLGEAADALGYSRRQCQRWWGAYTEGGLDELLVSRVDERGRQEFVTDKAWEELEEVMKEGRIATYAQARDFLAERGVQYASADSVGGLFRRRRVKLKTGRPRHEKADTEQQEAFKKSLPRRSPS
jgi:transposase